MFIMLNNILSARARVSSGQSRWTRHARQVERELSFGATCRPIRAGFEHSLCSTFFIPEAQIAARL